MKIEVEITQTMKLTQNQKTTLHKNQKSNSHFYKHSL
jgi:hypothetical protein